MSHRVYSHTSSVGIGARKIREIRSVDGEEAWGEAWAVEWVAGVAHRVVDSMAVAAMGADLLVVARRVVDLPVVDHRAVGDLVPHPMGRE